MLYIKQFENKIRRNAIRRINKATAVQKDGPRTNQEITAATVQLIDSAGENHGTIDINTALKMAADVGLDLIEIVPNATPPVCKIGDLGKLKYQNQKKAAQARKNQKTVEVKEIKMRPNIDVHDYNVKLKAMLKFLDNGDKVKITLRFRGRELAHQDLGAKLLNKVVEDIGEEYKLEFAPKVEGRQMIMIVAPK